ncbi:MAG: S-adenosylmethionine:tRNA ribosyltransferase-isomerase [Phycisphaeraceae bacterium]|nr:MAG: S-adenosylmethionine:tRNA ribosyltransferase-isomerase [Phycisphaeraceae bacterium]
MRTNDLEYDLPAELIATEPATPRDSARMLVVSRTDPSLCEHRHVRDLPEYLGPGDRLVMNATRVLPARFVGRNLDTGGGVQGLYLRDAEPTAEGRRTWVAMLKAKRTRPGRRVALENASGAPTGVELTLIERTDDESGAWVVAVDAPADAGTTAPEILARAGQTPLPPYILSARREHHLEVSDADDRARYQTVFAREDASASVAAPTAGLHFTPELLDRLGERGVERAQVLLSVGAGTFKPVEAERLEDHDMHAEWCSLNPAGPGVLAPAAGRRIAVGTTSVRTLEAFAAWTHEHPGEPAPEWLETRLLIAPGHRFEAVEGVLTNFHLPRSTLLALVAALFEGGMDRVREVYAAAIAERYRFYSYGDAMLVLP